MRNVDGKTLYLAGVHSGRMGMHLAGVRPAISKSTEMMVDCVKLSQIEFDRIVCLVSVYLAMCVGNTCLSRQ